MKDNTARPTVSFDVDQQPHGFSIDPARPGDKIRAETAGFHSFEEGILFYKLLNNFTVYADKANIKCHSVGNMLAILEPHRSTVYLNDDLPILATVKTNRKIDAGELVYQKDIVDIERIVFDGVAIPPNAGVILLLSFGWRKAFFFDFRPLNPSNSFQIDYDIGAIGGHLLSHLSFTEYFLLSETDWELVLNAGWFPFSFLIGKAWESLLNSIRINRDLDYEVDLIYESFLKVIDQKIDHWLYKQHLRNDREFIIRATEAFKKEDWISVVTIMTPRIEGLIRKSFLTYDSHFKMVTDLENALLEALPHQQSRLFPSQFASYLKRVYLKKIGFSSPGKELSRHTVAHGITDSTLMDKTYAVKTMLLLDHLFHCLPSDEVVT